MSIKSRLNQLEKSLIVHHQRYDTRRNNMDQSLYFQLMLEVSIGSTVACIEIATCVRKRI